MLGEDTLWVGLCHAVPSNTEDRVAVGEEVDLGGGDKGGLVDRGDPVLTRAAGDRRITEGRRLYREREPVVSGGHGPATTPRVRVSSTARKRRRPERRQRRQGPAARESWHTAPYGQPRINR